MQIYIAVIALVFSAATGFAGAWKLQQGNIDDIEKSRLVAAAAAQSELHAVEQAGREAVIRAQNAARAREAKLRSDAAGARRALDGLRAATESAMSYAGTNHEACVVATATTSQLLNQCSGEYQDLAEKADRHVSDVQTLMDAK